MMNHCVPDFDMDDDYSNPTSAGLSRPRKSSMPDEEIMELLWQNGQVVTQNQNQRSFKKSLQSKYDGGIPGEQPTAREIRPQSQALGEPSASHQHHNLFMQEDEMASWLHYPLHDSTFDQDFCADLLYAAPSVTTTTTATPPNRTTPTTTEATTSRPPMPPASKSEVEPKLVQNFALFSRQKARIEPESLARPSSSKSVVRESTVVDSSDTPRLGQESRVSHTARSVEEASGVNIGFGTLRGAAVARSSSGGGGKETMTCEKTVTSSPDGSSASAEPSLKQPAPPEDRKRKGREADDVECHSEDAEIESGNRMKQVRGSTSTKRSRAAEVHNLSERRRRDRINEKMRALQELIPRCNKSDKASMLDEAIEYLKSLQMQVQMMSMGCSMVPMMFPGVQQYMPQMGMGIGMGVQMGMDMGMSRPMMPFPNVLAGSGLPTPAAAGHSGPRFPMLSFHTPPIPSRILATSQSDAMITSHGMQIPNQPRVPNFADPYQQYLGLHQMQLAQVQNQAMAQPSTSKPSTEKGAKNLENHQSGAG